MDTQSTILIQSRQLILKTIKGLSLKQLNTIPSGFNNNIAWNVAHLAVTHQILCYKFANLSSSVSDDFINLYRKGTKPEKDITQNEWEYIVEIFENLPIAFKKDLKNEIFTSYAEYETSMGVTLKNINDAINYNTHHEGIHLGAILQLKKLV